VKDCECESNVIQNFERTVCIGRELLILYKVKVDKFVDMHDFDAGLKNFHPQLGALLRLGALGPGPVDPLDKTVLRRYKLVSRPVGDSRAQSDH
jgi:hypothetical protein